MACCVMAGFVYIYLNRAYDTFKFDPSNHSVESNVIDDLGIYQYQKTHSLSLNINGMYCVECSKTIEDALMKLPGVQSVHVLDMESRGIIVFDPIVNPEVQSDVITRIEELGYDASVIQNEKESADATLMNLKKQYDEFLKAGFYALSVVLIQWGMKKLKDPIIITPPMIFITILSSIAQLKVKTFIRQAWFGLKVGRLGMPILLAISTTVIFTYSVFNCYKLLMTFDSQFLLRIHFDSSTGLLFVVFGGKYLEKLTKLSLSSNITKLNSLLPESVILYNDPKHPSVVPSEFIQPSDMILIRPGSKIPADGIIVQESSFIDELNITGEIKPSWKSPGSLVLAGTLNLTHQIVVQATSNVENSEINRIVTSLRSQDWRSSDDQYMNSYKYVDVILSIFVPLVISLSLLTFYYWYYIIGDTDQGILRPLSTLTVACPCALGLSVPSVMISGMNALSELGIYIRRCSILKMKELLDSSHSGNQPTLLLLDKTGTLTTRNLEVTDVSYVNYIDGNLLWKLIYEVERFENHPIAECITAFAKLSISESSDIALNSVEITKMSRHDGSGISAVIKYAEDEHTVLIGNRKMMSNVDLGKVDDKDIYVVINLKLRLSFNLQNIAIRRDSSDMIGFFRSFGIEPVLVSGDNFKNCSKIGKALNITQVHHSMSPMGKLKIVEDYKEKGYKLIMIGDGLNDSASLKYSDLSISLKTGHQTAIDSSDIILMNDRFDRIKEIYRVAHKVVRKINTNLRMSLVYNLFLLVLASGALSFLDAKLVVDISSSSTLMSFSSLFVVLNSRITDDSKPSTSEMKKKLRGV